MQPSRHKVVALAKFRSGKPRRPIFIHGLLTGDLLKAAS
jgi:hypothetical protein